MMNETQFGMNARTRRMIVSAIRWVGPFLLSAMATAFIGWGSVQYAKGTTEQRLQTVERDVKAAQSEHEQFVRRDAFQILLDDVKEIKSDVRVIRNERAERVVAVK